MEIADKFDVFFFDAWGVFNIGGTISKSAVAVMADLQTRGKSVSIMSNTPQSAAGVTAHYGKSGLIPGVHYQNIFSSGQLCMDIARRGEIPAPGKKYYVAWDYTCGLPGGGASYDMFAGTDYSKVADISSADFVYLDFPRAASNLITDEKLMEPELSKVIAAGKPVICTNPDLHACHGNEFVIMQGTPARIFAAHGLKIIYYGKPHPEIYLDAMNKIGNVDAARTLMVGDTLHTDILGARRAGIKSCLTLADGITARDLTLAGRELNRENINAAGAKIDAVPDYIIEKVADSH